MTPAPVRPILVAHLIHGFGVGGLESVVLELIRRLPEGEFRHAVICLTTWEEAMACRLPPGVTLHALNKRPGKDWAVWFRLWLLLRQLRPRILHSCNIATLEGALPALLAGVPVRIHAEHGRDIHDLDGSNRAYRWLRRLYAPLIHAFVPVSRELEQWLLHGVKIPASKVRMIPNGVDLERFRPGLGPPPGLPAGFIPPQAFVMGSVGRLAAVKDHATLVRGFHALMQRFPGRSLRLLLVGEGPLRGALESLVAELGVEAAVHFAGAQADIPAWLGEMNVFVLSSLAEGMPLTLLEAMACGLPCVATRSGDCPEVIQEGESGFLCAVGDAEGLAQLLARYVEEPGLAARHGARGRELVARGYALEVTVERYRRLFLELSPGG